MSILETDVQYDEMAEQCVLGSMILAPAAAVEVFSSDLTVDDLYLPRHQVIFTALEAAYLGGQTPDAVLLADELARTGDLPRVGGAAYLADLVQAPPTTANVSHYVRIVTDQAKRRRLTAAGMRITQLGSVETGTVDEAIDQAGAALLSVTRTSSSRAAAGAPELWDQAMHTLDHGPSTAPQGVRTGFSDLDDMLQGMQPGQVVTIAARPSVGKTAFALDCMRHAAVDQRIPTLFFSMEMSTPELMQRVVAAQAGVQLSTIRNAMLGHAPLPPPDRDRIQAQSDRIRTAPFFISDDAAVTLMDVRAVTRRMVQAEGVRLVVIDYLQLMSTPGRPENRQLEVAALSRGLKVLAKELGVTVMMLSQMSRGVEQRADRRPLLSDLRDSGAVEQDSDIVIFLSREEMYDPQTTRKGEADIIVAKHRNGPTGTVAVAFQGHYSRFVDMARM